MKTNTHPQFYTDAKVTCACGNTFTTGSTMERINVELCSKCHPFYTGKVRIVDTASLVRKFEERKNAAKTEALNRRDKRAAKRNKRRLTVEEGHEKRLTLKDMLSQMR